ncbi:TatD family hydrolase [Marilutibacter aestuarii]|uniref:TatD family deoxyribonuclease n=1 Tax=Marilutibacter aestuarii TaxID=1706195 RepID=A0A508A6L3_9GAMM|nr:TatD family hydrolase [Lysobacter aestuarii]TQD44443.1 TatD family deoxyribonuclease [Lysobacter aestuarii]
MVDSHCHLDAPRFDADRDAVIARARAAGVTRQVVPAVTAASWAGLRDACRRAPGLYAAYGLHPMFMDAHEPGDLERLARWLQTEKAVAVGECGLDFFVEGFDAEAQAFYFEGQLRLARDLDLPLIIHARKAVDAVMAAIRRFAPLRGVVHSFSGSLDQAQRLHGMGFMIGLGGPVTHERARRLRRVAAEVDIESLLVETDAPDQPDAGIRGERNEPARLPHVVEAIAHLRGMAPEALARATARNAERLFGLPPA